MKVPKTILDDPRIKQMYEQFVKKQSGKGKMMKGAGLWDSFVDFLKKSKVISNVGSVLLPVAAGALGGTLGSALAGPAGTATGAAAGAAAGKSAAEYIKSLGFGKRKVGRGGMSNLAISQQGTRLGQKGMKGKGCGCGKKMRGGAVTYGMNGIYQDIPGTVPERKMIGGQSAAFNSVASQFGNVKF